MEGNRPKISELSTCRMFSYNNPQEPITKEGFRGAFWGDVEPQPLDMMAVRGIPQTVRVFGFQALRTTEAGPAEIGLHPEMQQTELTYPIQGAMDMLIRTPEEHDVVSHMEGVVPQEIALEGAQFQINRQNELIINLANGVQYVTMPTVTPVGANHATMPLNEECIYLAVKLAQ